LLINLDLSLLQAEVYVTLLEARETGIQAISILSKLPQLDVDTALCELEELWFGQKSKPFFNIDSLNMTAKWGVILFPLHF